MTKQLDELAHEVRILKLEARKLELENRITHLKSEQLIDGDCIGCAGPCKVVDVAAELQEEIDKCSADLSVYRGIVRNRDKIIEELKDSNTEDLKELYDFHEEELRGIKADRTSIKSDRDIMFQNYRNTIAKLQGDIGVLEAELSVRKEDSAVLMEVVEIIRDDTIPNSRVPCMICNLLDDYLDAPEVPENTTIDETPEITITVDKRDVAIRNLAMIKVAFLELP